MRTCALNLSSLFLLLQVTPSHGQSQFQCQWDEEPCNAIMNKKCNVGGDDNGNGSCPPQSDCYDCDPMQEFNYNCEACVEAGGFWCPGDARCQSRRLGQEYFSTFRPYRFYNSCPKQDDWKQSCPTFNSTTSTAVFSDPLYDGMAWQYKMIRVEEVWRQGITGAGVRVRINDGGLDANHNEIAPNLNRQNSCDGSFQPPQNNQETPGYKHGTAVASILAGAANNNQCAAGIAPDSSISFCKKSLDNPLDDALVLIQKLNTFDISSNSWGPAPCYVPLLGVRRRRLQQCTFQYNGYPNAPCNVCGDNIDLENKACKDSIVYHCKTLYKLDQSACNNYLDLFVKCDYHTLLPTIEDAMVQAVTQGRDGKGIVFVFPAGNENEEGSFANFDGFVNSRFTIAVAGVHKQAEITSYSTTGSPVFIAAPGGDEDYVSNNIVANYGGGCTDSGYGTSFSTPIVSGVVALMLQVNPGLTWRDVQGVLAASAQQNDPNDRSWGINAAGVKHSYKYGFGLVDAVAAVDLSKTWTNWGPEQQITVDSGSVNIIIPDDASKTATSKVSVAGDDYSNFIIESVEVSLDLQHGSRGDVQIRLVSPSGTGSIVAVGKRPERTVLTDGERWTLMTLRNWGEVPVGEWALQIKDQKNGQSAGGCEDLSWVYFNMQNLAGIGCDALENDGACVDGEAVGRYQGRTELYTMISSFGGDDFLSPLEACCVCGGGTVRSSEQVLKSWKLVVYGHRPVPTPAPTAVPTAAPTLAPTASPTPAPTPAPVATPAPTAVPTLAPTASPTPAPTPAPEGSNGGNRGENNGGNEGNGDAAASESISRTAPVEWTESPTVIAVEVSRSRSEGGVSDEMEEDIPSRGADDLPFSSGPGHLFLSGSVFPAVAGLFVLCHMIWL